ncbi:unnamed protein product [Blepharisma stoltei]|uniref:Uncharacterized protein n=1 Tax=Blepharisma stoltei TaxID=1481888 RepID=A0AAU9ITV8_9CILI|nr:unnamed protein product [Blepharisma stoltei]
MKNDVSHTNALSSFKKFGQLIYDFGYSADLALTINRLIAKNHYDLLEDALENLKNLNQDFEIIQDTLLADFSQWSDCDSQKIVYNSIIPIWIFDHKEPIDLYYNLYDAIGIFIYNGQSLLSEVEGKRNFQDHAKFLFMNGLGSLFYYSNITINGLVTCEIDRVASTGSTINILLICGIFALGILILVIMGYIILISRKYDEFWNYCLNNAQWPIFKLKCAALDRLATIHGVDKAVETGSENKRKSSHKREVKGTLYLQYFIRLMLLFTIAASYYLLIFNYLYPNLDTMMMHRPHILDNFIIRRSLLSRATVFSREILFNYTYNYLPELYAFPNSELILDQTLCQLTQRNNEIREGRYLDLLSHELKEKMFAKNDSPYWWLNKGTQPAFDMVIGDTENFENLGEVTDDEWIFFSKMGKTIQDEIGEEFDLADRDSKNAIQEQLNVIIYTTVIYSVALGVLYFFYYLPYMKNQIKQLNLFSVLPKILPEKYD